MAVMGSIMSRDHLAIAIKVSHASLECKFCPLLPSPFIFISCSHIHCRFGFSDPNHVGCINLQFLGVIRNELASLVVSLEIGYFALKYGENLT